jgi:DNA-binding transcriptional regulator YiaG
MRKLNPAIHRIKYKQRKPQVRKARETRLHQGARFKILLIDAGLTPETAAQMLHVTPRTIRYWVSGRVTVPYAAFRLLRVMRLFELPVPGWEGWHMHSGKLWSPEGHGFIPSDSSWWGLLVRKAALFGQMYDRDRQLDIAMQRMRDGGTEQPESGRRDALASLRPVTVAPDYPSEARGRAAQPPGPNLFNSTL